MQNNAFPDSAVHGALLNTGLIATYRNLESRLALTAPGTPVPDLAPDGVQGGCSTQIAMIALEIAALGTEIDGGAFPRPQAIAALALISGAAANIRGLATAAITSGG
jgi:hypothetical protein